MLSGATLHVAIRDPGDEAMARDTEAGSEVQSPVGMEVTRPKKDKTDLR